MTSIAVLLSTKQCCVFLSTQLLPIPSYSTQALLALSQQPYARGCPCGLYSLAASELSWARLMFFRHPRFQRRWNIEPPPRSHVPNNSTPSIHLSAPKRLKRTWPRSVTGFPAAVHARSASIRARRGPAPYACLPPAASTNMARLLWWHLEPIVAN